MARKNPTRGACRVVLIGLMGSGKTTIGRLLAARTGWPYHDNDDLLLHAFGGNPRELMAERGEDRMHAAEAEALRFGLSEPAPCLIGAAAASVLDPASVARLSQAVVVWLRARPDTLVPRAIGAAHRPFLATDPLAWLTAAAAARDPLYRAAADITVDVDRLPPPQVADAILAALAQLDVCATVLRAAS